MKVQQQSTCSVRDGGGWQHWQQHKDMATSRSHTAGEDSPCNENQHAKTMKLRQWKKCNQRAVWDMVMVTATSTATPTSGTADDDSTISTRCGANHDKKDTKMEIVKVQQSTCGVKDDNVGSIDSNLRDSNTTQWHYWQEQTSSGNQYTKQQGPTQQCRLDCNSACLQSLYAGCSWGWAVTTTAAEAKQWWWWQQQPLTGWIYFLKTINHQWQQQHNVCLAMQVNDNTEAEHVAAMPALAGIRIILKNSKNWTINQQQ